MRRRNCFFVFVILIGITITLGLNLGKKDQLTTINSSIDQNNSSNESFRDYEILPKTSDTQNYDKINMIQREIFFSHMNHPYKLLIMLFIVLNQSESWTQSIRHL